MVRFVHLLFAAARVSAFQLNDYPRNATVGRSYNISWVDNPASVDIVLQTAYLDSGYEAALTRGALGSSYIWQVDSTLKPRDDYILILSSGEQLLRSDGITISNTTTRPGSSSGLTIDPDPPNSGPSTGVKVGISVGVVVGLLLLVGLVVLVWLRRRRKRAPKVGGSPIHNGENGLELNGAPMYEAGSKHIPNELPGDRPVSPEMRG
ncbi:MAG: hypothetical protein M1814_003594 [Vezdaea aestivalis]|nr:MAG: hypothetical protein M1814_003594 [Vezdaea aestivalis]